MTKLIRLRDRGRSGEMMNNAQKPTLSQERPFPAELRAMPMREREAILASQAAFAEDIYREDHQLTDFEAFDAGDLHGDSSSAETR